MHAQSSGCACFLSRPRARNRFSAGGEYNDTDFGSVRRFGTTSAVDPGLKSAFLQERGVFTVSVYKIEQNDILTRDPVTPSLTVQGGSREAKGVELDFSFAVTPQWQVGANAAFIDAEFTKLFEAGGADRSGNRPPNVTNHVFNLDTSYRLAGLPLTLGAALRHAGDFYTDNANTIRIKGYAVLDASISYRLAGSMLTLRGRNLMDRFYADWTCRRWSRWGRAAGLRCPRAWRRRPPPHHGRWPRHSPIRPAPGRACHGWPACPDRAC